MKLNKNTLLYPIIRNVSYDDTTNGNNNYAVCQYRDPYGPTAARYTRRGKQTHAHHSLVIAVHTGCNMLARFYAVL